MFGVVGVVGVLDGSRDVLANVLEGEEEIELNRQRRKRSKHDQRDEPDTERSSTRRDRSRFEPDERNNQVSQISDERI